MMFFLEIATTPTTTTGSSTTHTVTGSGTITTMEQWNISTVEENKEHRSDNFFLHFFIFLCSI